MEVSIQQFVIPGIVKDLKASFFIDTPNNYYMITNTIRQIHKPSAKANCTEFILVLEVDKTSGLFDEPTYIPF